MENLEINKIYNCDCLEGLKKLPENSVNLTVTSPPYDDLRSYGDTLEWNFDVFKEIAKELYRVTKPGGVVVWVVGDACIKGSETGTSFKQALYFKDECGFMLHDTMIYEKNGSSRPAKRTSKRYSQIFEYMFVFTKGEIRKDITLIADKRNKWAGWAKWGKNSAFNVKGDLVEVKKQQPVISEFSVRNNIWKYSVSFNDKTGHPAVFPEKLAEDNILSWSNEGDLVLDPFMGSGTTAKMAMLNNRNFIGFEKNPEYYEKSLERIEKYVDKKNENINITTITNEDGQEDNYQYNTSEDKELSGKTELWDKYVEQLNQYFNEQTLSTLKTLKFNFVTKTNEERVRKITGVDETNVDSVKQEIERLQNVLNTLECSDNTIETIINHPTIVVNDENHITTQAIETPYIENHPENNLLPFDLEKYLFDFLLKYYQLKRLPDTVIEVNECAREEKKLQEENEKLREENIIEKPKKRKRRTKAEMEEARKKEQENTINYVHVVGNETTSIGVETYTNNENNDELPFDFSDENPINDEPIVKIKRPRGRPRKIKTEVIEMI